MKTRFLVVVVLSLVLLISTAPPSTARILEAPATFQSSNLDELTVPMGGGRSTIVSPSSPSFNFPCEFAGWATAFYEDFDSVTPPNLPPGWATAPLNGTVAEWQTHVGTNEPAGASAASPPNLVYFNSYSAFAGETARLYRTTALDLRGYTDPFLCLRWYRDPGYSGSSDNVLLQVSTNGGSNWTGVGTALMRYSTSAAWWSAAISINSVAGGNSSVLIGFLGTSAYGNDVHLDDIQITAIPYIYLPLLMR